jgi:hypothetical protein
VVWGNGGQASELPVWLALLLLFSALLIFTSLFHVYIPPEDPTEKTFNHRVIVGIILMLSGLSLTPLLYWL